MGLADDADEQHDGQVRVVSIPRIRTRGVAWLANRWRLHRWLEREARERRIDVVEVPEFEGMLPFRFSACPVLVRLHLAATTIATMAGTRVPRTLRWCERETLRLHRDWAACSQHAFALTHQAFGLRQSGGFVTGVPLDLPEHLAPPPLPGRFILFAGTVSERKGAVLLARAARRLLADRPDLHLVYAGRELHADGYPIAQKIRAEVGPALSARIHMLGCLTRAQVLGAMARASAFTLPSGLETFGLVYAEAMAQGCPVIAPRAPPFDEFIEHGVTGLLVDPGDPEALTIGLERVLNDVAFATRMAKRAHEYAHGTFGRTMVAGEAIGLYHSLISNHESRSLVTHNEL